MLTTGWNMYGQLGARSPTNSDRSTFQPVFYGVKAIAAGTRHSMVLTQDGGVWATGYNLHGELGDGSTITKNGFVEVISGNAEAVAAGGYHSMVLKGDGSVWCTGSNEYGQIGDGSTTTRESFVRVVTLRGGAFPPHTFGDDDIFFILKIRLKLSAPMGMRSDLIPVSHAEQVAPQRPGRLRYQQPCRGYEEKVNSSAYESF